MAQARHLEQRLVSPGHRPAQLLAVKAMGDFVDDHFWPLLYPALIVGSLYGLSRGGFVNVGLGALGALAGAVLSFLALMSLGIDNAAVSFAALVLSSWLGAVGTLSVRQAFFER